MLCLHEKEETLSAKANAHDESFILGTMETPSSLMTHWNQSTHHFWIGSFIHSIQSCFLLLAMITIHTLNFIHPSIRGKMTTSALMPKCHRLLPESQQTVVASCFVSHSLFIVSLGLLTVQCTVVVVVVPVKRVYIPHDREISPVHHMFDILF